MTKEEFKTKSIKNGLLTWDKVDDVHFDYLYGDLHFTDSSLAQIFEVSIEAVIKNVKNLVFQ